MKNLRDHTTEESSTSGRGVFYRDENQANSIVVGIPRDTDGTTLGSAVLHTQQYATEEVAIDESTPAGTVFIPQLIRDRHSRWFAGWPRFLLTRVDDAFGFHSRWSSRTSEALHGWWVLENSFTSHKRTIEGVRAFVLSLIKNLDFEIDG